MGASSVVGGKAARACDYCIKVRARWYCAADDAFLCQSCDSSVHSANPVARRHQRVRLKTGSIKHSLGAVSVPRWHRGLCRRVRTPRQKKIASEEATRVPEDSGGKESPVKNEAQLLYQVPNFDDEETMADSSLQVLTDFFHSDVDLDNFSADVESLLGKGHENETFNMSELGLLECESVVKVENEAIAGNCSDHQPQANSELNSEFDSPISGDGDNSNEHHDSSKVFLKLNYDIVLSSWGSKKSPWTTGERPDSNSTHCWLPESTGCCGTMHSHGATGTVTGNAGDDGGREARVSRYREKRRTRLFSKKIRYEVRKLNAEKRPRMKGRFIKRSNPPLL